MSVIVEKWIIVIALFMIYFTISGLATTNIIRLTKSNTLPVLSSKCYCDDCGAKIPPFFQLPIISYILCRGKCRNCGGIIPTYPLYLEIATWTGMFGISALLNHSILGISLSFLYYEILRIMIVWMKGKRENHFIREYIIAVIAMLPFYIVTLFVSILYTSI